MEDRQENEDGVRRGCLAGLLPIAAALVGGVLGGAVAGFWAVESVRGVDAVFHPIFWAVPLGVLMGAVGSAAAVSIYFVSSRK